MSSRRHLLLDWRAGWQAAHLATTLEIDPQGRLALGPRPDSGRLLADEHGSLGGLVEPTGLAVACDGMVYISDAGSHCIKAYDPCSCRFAQLAFIGGPGSSPRQLQQPQGLAVTPQGDLIVADTGNRRLQIFTLKGLALRSLWGPYRIRRDGGAVTIEPLPSPAAPESDEFPEGTWTPWDVAVAGCTVWVADHSNGLVHHFSHTGRWLGAISHGPDGTLLQHPKHLATDSNGRLYVVQEGAAEVLVFDHHGSFVQLVSRPREVSGRFQPAAVAVAPDGSLSLTCCTSSGDTTQRWQQGATGLAPCGTAIPGCGRVLAFDREGRALAIDGSAIRCLDPAIRYEPDGQLVTRALDSRIYRCSWHRVVIHGQVAAGTRVRVETLTAESAKGDDEIKALPEQRWRLAAEHELSGVNEWDCLVRSEPGRYLWLRLSLSGDGESTPLLDSVQIEYPRSTSLRYLPAVYQQDQESRDFLERLLALLDSINDETAELLDGIAAYFDPWATPASPDRDFLTWLAAWIGLSLDRHWPLARRRALLAQAHQLYALRGTVAGLRRHLQLYTGIEPQILELFRIRRWLHLGGGASLGDCSELWGDRLAHRLQLDVQSRIGEFQLIDTGDPATDPWAALAHRFTVYVPLPGPASDEQRLTLHRIIELAKPAHTEAELVIVEPLLRIGRQSRVGVDTRIAAYPSGVVTGSTTLRQGSVLGPSVKQEARPVFCIGSSSRIGSSTTLD